MKKRILTGILASLTCGLINVAHAEVYTVNPNDSYGYLGLMLGMSRVTGDPEHEIIDDIRIISDTSGNRFTGRIFGGYMINNYIGLELGGAAMATPNLRIAGVNRFDRLVPRENVETFFGWVDLSIKVQLQLRYLSLYAKGGLALTHFSFDVDVPNEVIIVNNNNNGNGVNGNGTNGNGTNGNGTNGGSTVIIATDHDGAIITPNNNNGTVVVAGDDDDINDIDDDDDDFDTRTESQTKVGAIFGVGVAYNLTPNWVVDLSYNHLYVRNKLIDNLNFIALGITYRFVNVYCGQFLCDP